MTNGAAEPESLLTVLCDDVRQEEHGKMSLIGVYAARTINFPSFPAGRKSLFLVDTVRGLEGGQTTLHHTLTAPDGVTFVVGDEETNEVSKEIDGEIPEGSNMVLAADFGPIQFKQGGTYTSDLELRRDGDLLWERTFTFEVGQDPSLPER